jgi:hypothetical protein
MIDYKNLLETLFEKVERMRTERPTAGTRFRLMGLAADVTEATEMMTQEVLERVTKEVVLDADTDIDYTETGERVQAMVLTAPNDDLQEATQGVNDALATLSDVLLKIAVQLTRHRNNDEYARLYEQEKKRYLNSGTAQRARGKYTDWKDSVCYGSPSMEDIEDYRLEKVVRIFEQGVLTSRVEHVRRATRYPSELDFDLLPDDNLFKKTAYRYYSELRKMVDWQDGYLVVMPHRIGQHFYMSRHEENAKSHRTNLLKYLHKIDMVQQERRRLLESEMQGGDALNPQLNYFAPAKNLKVLLAEEWFEIHRTDKRFDGQWTEALVNALMRSEHKDYIATEWGKDKRQDFIRGCLLGLLKEGGVIKGSMDSIARSANVCDNYRTFSKYMGQCRQEPYADWVLEYVGRSEK